MGQYNISTIRGGGGVAASFGIWIDLPLAYCYFNTLQQMVNFYEENLNYRKNLNLPRKCLPSENISTSPTNFTPSRSNPNSKI